MTPPVPPALPTPWWRQPWARLLRSGALVALALLGSALGIGYLNWQQNQLLDGSQAYRRQYGPWSSFQLEAEALRLARALYAYLDAPDAARLAAASQRLDILVSRLSLLEQ
jgi:hypothetical protein